MIKKTALGIASAAVISVAALSGTASTAQAGSFGFSFHGGGVGVHVAPGYYGGHGFYRNPCRHWKRKYRRTGKWKYWRRYQRCLDRHDW